MNKHALAEFLDKATDEEITTLVDLAGTSLAYLKHIAKGRRKASSELAGKIEDGALMLILERRTLPQLSRGDISETCGECPYYLQCQQVKK